jgi:EAL domain-containing protein (putative c-di-GMP-specific phosphodiesterase class I)
MVMYCQSEDVSMERVMVEITESAAMNDALEALDVLTRPRIRGFHLSIDDFGAGFSSLMRLRRLPVTEIKIDRSFVSDMLTSPDAFVIVKSVIALAKSLGLAVVAEGVETDEHYRQLAELGCDIGQGYGIAKPMSASEILVWNARRQQQREPERVNV